MYKYPSLPLLLSLALALLLAGCDQGPDANLSPLQRAQKYYQQGAIDESLVELRNAIQGDTGDPEARRLLGQVYLRMGYGEAAEVALRRSVEMGQATDRVVVDLARSLLVQGKPREVLALGDWRHFLSPAQRGELYAYRGEAHLNMGERAEAAQEIEQALTEAPEGERPLLAAARLARAEERYHNMETLLQRLIKSYPESSEGWSLLGDLYRLTNRLEEAEEAYRQAIAHREIKGESIDLLNRALIYIARGEYDKGRADVDRVIKAYPEYFQGYFIKGLLHFLMEDYDSARTALENALKYMPGYPLARYYLAASLLARGQYLQADQYAQSYLSEQPYSGEGRGLWALVHAVQGDYAKAREILEPYLEGTPQYLPALRLLGGILLTEGDTSWGLRVLDQALAIDASGVQDTSWLRLSLLEEQDEYQLIYRLPAVQELEDNLQLREVLMVLNLIRSGSGELALGAARRFQESYPDQPLPRDLLGLALLRARQPEEARAVFRQVTEQVPGDPLALLSLAALELQDGNEQAAREHYLETLTHRPGHLDSLVLLGELALSQGDNEAAENWLRQAVEHHPLSALPRIRLARLHLDLGRPYRALAQGQGLVEVRNPILLELLGRAHLELGQYEEAIGRFERINELQPGTTQAHYLLAKAYALRGEPRMARQALGEALRLDPDYLPAQILLVQWLTSRGHLQEAQERLAELNQVHANHPELIAQQGLLHVRQGQITQARDAFERSLELAPSVRVAVSLADARWQSGDRQGALDLLEDWTRSQIQNLEAFHALAGFYFLDGRREQTMEVYRRVLERWPEDLRALNNLAFLLRQEDRQQARNYAERALELGGSDPAVLDTLASILLEEYEGDSFQVDRALNLLRRAREQAPDNPTIGYHLALALSRAGEEDQAQEVLEQVLDGHRDFPELSQARQLRDVLAAGG